MCLRIIKFFRTNFKENGKVFQWINEEVIDKIGFKEYCVWKNVAWEKVRESLDDLFSRPFNLIGDYLFRINLFKISENNFLLALCFHQIIIDRTSMEMVVQELNCCYNWVSKERNFKNQPIMITSILFNINWKRILKIPQRSISETAIFKFS